ncbi:MAG TPA: hypothetical protein VFW78_13585 [Bacteroidia bacterium]|nr:hypothetical protein [Bacteroidia bacterium]
MRLLTGFFLIALLLPAKLSGQQLTTGDTLQHHRVILIPYDPRYYLSDADRDIMEQSNMDAARFRANFRQTIDRNVQRAINSSYECISLLNDTADRLEQTLGEVIGHTGYRYEKAIPVTPKTGRDGGLFQSRTSDPKDHADSRTATQYIPVAEDAMYMRAIVSKPEALFTKLSEEYEADYFVFLTQMEIKTNYKSCMDIANKVYRREIMIHFTIYDKYGHLIAGSYATSYFPSNSNSAGKIMGDCFPELASYVAGCLP